MASQSDEISDEENRNNSDIGTIEVAIDAGATLSKSACASISRKRKIHVNEGKYKQREKWQQPKKHVLSIYPKQNDAREQATFF